MRFPSWTLAPRIVILVCVWNPKWIGLALVALGAVACSSTDEAPPAPEPQKQVTLPNVDVTAVEGRIDRPYSFNLRTHDPTGEARKYTLFSGELPAGLTLGEDGLISGTPSSTGQREAVVFGQGACGDASCRLQMRLTVPIANVLLISGFGPFAGMPDNPSWKAVEPLHDTMIAGLDVRVIEVPVVWDTSLPTFFDEYFRLKPVIAIAAGVAMGEQVIRLEATARNYATGTDEAADPWPTGKIDPSGPDKYKALMPLQALRPAMEAKGYPTAISDNAGDFLCNYLFYGLMKQLTAENPEQHILGGFIHVPGPEVVSTEKMTEAFKLVINNVAEYRAELISLHRAPGDGMDPAATLHEPPVY